MSTRSTTPIRITRLSEVDPSENPFVGEKVSGLATLIRLGMNVPDGFVITGLQPGEQLPRSEIEKNYKGIGEGSVSIRLSFQSFEEPKTEAQAIAVAKLAKARKEVSAATALLNVRGIDEVLQGVEAALMAAFSVLMSEMTEKQSRAEAEDDEDYEGGGGAAGKDMMQSVINQASVLVQQMAGRGGTGGFGSTSRDALLITAGTVSTADVLKKDRASVLIETTPFAVGTRSSSSSAAASAAAAATAITAASPKGDADAEGGGSIDPEALVDEAGGGGSGAGGGGGSSGAAGGSGGSSSGGGSSNPNTPTKKKGKSASSPVTPNKVTNFWVLSKEAEVVEQVIADKAIGLSPLCLQQLVMQALNVEKECHFPVELTFVIDVNSNVHWLQVKPIAGVASGDLKELDTIPHSLNDVYSRCDVCDIVAGTLSPISATTIGKGVEMGLQKWMVSIGVLPATIDDAFTAGLFYNQLFVNVTSIGLLCTRVFGWTQERHQWNLLGQLVSGIQYEDPAPFLERAINSMYCLTSLLSTTMGLERFTQEVMSYTPITINNVTNLSENTTFYRDVFERIETGMNLLRRSFEFHMESRMAAILAVSAVLALSADDVRTEDEYQPYYGAGEDEQEQAQARKQKASLHKKSMDEDGFSKLCENPTLLRQYHRGVVQLLLGPDKTQSPTSPSSSSTSPTSSSTSASATSSSSSASSSSSSSSSTTTTTTSSSSSTMLDVDDDEPDVATGIASSSRHSQASTSGSGSSPPTTHHRTSDLIRQFKALMEEMKQLPSELRDEIMRRDPEDVYKWFKGKTQLQGKYCGTIGATFRKFLDLHGHHCFRGLEIRNMGWRDNPYEVIVAIQTLLREHELESDQSFNALKSQLKSSITADTTVAGEGSGAAAAAAGMAAMAGTKTMRMASAINAENESGMLLEETTALQLILPLARAALRRRTRTRGYVARIAYQLKLAYKLLLDLLTKAGLIPEDDIGYFLTFEEIRDIVYSTGGGLSNPQKSFSMGSLPEKSTRAGQKVVQRWEDPSHVSFHVVKKAIKRRLLYGYQMSFRFPDVCPPGVPTPLVGNVRSINSIIQYHLKRGELRAGSGNNEWDRELKGFPCWKVGRPGGIVQGIARIVTTPQDAKSLQTGDILITDTPDPFFLLFYSLIAAHVCNMGGAISEGALMALDTSMPMVLGTRLATRVFQSGDLLLVDASRGFVRQLRPATQ